MRGMAREQLVCVVASLAEVLVACALLPFAETPNQVLLCALAATIGVAAFAFSITE
jgi:uncharacterized membrane protein